MQGSSFYTIKIYKGKYSSVKKNIEAGSKISTSGLEAGSKISTSGLREEYFDYNFNNDRYRRKCQHLLIRHVSAAPK